MAHKKGQGSTRNGRDSPAQRRGVKMFGGQPPRPATSWCARSARASIRARTSAWGATTRCSRKIDGIVQYARLGKDRKQVHVLPSA